MSQVVVTAAYRLRAGPDNTFDANFEKFLEQVGRDLLVGTFDDFHRSIFKDDAAFKAFRERGQAAASCEDDRNRADVANGIYGFRIVFDETLFADPSYGLQRLIHTLASDVYLRRISDHDGAVTVKSIEFGALQATMEGAYRPASHTRAAIRAAFRLPPHRPLLAYSMKPRACLTDEEYYEIVRQAFDGGCDIVELDTRDLQLDAPRVALLENLSQLALDMSKDRVCRFSANLSGPLRVIGPIYERLAAAHERAEPGGPWVIKIDGNLDGLSTVQAIRAGALSGYAQPIITCYPVLKYALASALGPDGFVRMLAMSGVDIIYPGQAPNFGDANGRIDTEQVAAGRAHYAAMDMGGYPLLSVAGGIAINTVHAYLSVLGSDIAFFVGGGIGTSKVGIKTGANHFARAIKLACADLFEGARLKDLEGDFVKLSKIYFTDREIPEDYEFIRPAALKKIPGRVRSTNMED